MGGAALALWAARPSDVPGQAAEGRGGLRPSAATRPARPEALVDLAATRAPEEAITAALAPLPPEDAEWVLDEAARYQAARAMDAQQLTELITQLASVRMHEVIERTEPLMPRQQGAP